MCRELKQRNIRPFPFGLSGLKLPIRKKISADWSQPELEIDYDNRTDFRENKKKYAAVDCNGSLIMDSEVESWDGLHAYACVATPQAEIQLRCATIKLVGVCGAQVSQMDQVFNGGVTECYNKAHGHPLGRGRWQVDCLKRIYSDTRAHAKTIDPSSRCHRNSNRSFTFSTLIYITAETTISQEDSWACLFSYLYHEYIPSYGGEWSSFLSDNTCGVYYHAANFVYGNFPAGCRRQCGRRPETYRRRNPIRHSAMQRTPAVFTRFPQFLIMGEMMENVSAGGFGNTGQILRT
jgi:hypothetical protein